MPEDQQHRLENLALDLANKSQSLASTLNNEVIYPSLKPVERACFT